MLFAVVASGGHFGRRYMLGRIGGLFVMLLVVGSLSCGEKNSFLFVVECGYLWLVCV